LTFEQDRHYLIASVFRFLDGRSVESVRHVLEGLRAEGASVFLDDVVASLGTGRQTKTPRDVLTDTPSIPRQMALMEKRQEYNTPSAPDTGDQSRGIEA